MSDLVERLRNRKAFALNGTWMMLNAPDSDCQEACRPEATLQAIRSALYEPERLTLTTTSKARESISNIAVIRTRQRR